MKKFAKKFGLENGAMVEIEHINSSNEEKSLFFVYQDRDRMGVKEVLKQYEMILD